MDKNIGAQLYTLRNFCQTAEDLDTTFGKVKEIGYKIVQVSGIGDIPAEIVKKTADKHGLSIVCTHKSYDDYTKNLQGVIDYHKAINCQIAGLGSFNLTDLTLAKLQNDIATFNDIAEKLQENGLTFAYHNHASEFMKINGKYVIDYILEGTDPDKFKFIVDVYWLAVAGIDPATFIKKLGKRAICIHFKDLKVLEANKVIMTEVMEGNLDWDSIISACESAGSQWALVEEDDCQGDPFESLRISYNNLKAKGFC